MSIEILVRPSVEADVYEIAPRLREGDRLEVEAAGLPSPEYALKVSMENSQIAMTVEFNGKPEIMFGVSTTSVLTGKGCPWLLGTDAVLHHYRIFLRHSKGYLAMLEHGHDILQNVVDDRNTLSKRWLKWLGFELSDPVPVGVNGEMFRLFEKRV